MSDELDTALRQFHQRFDRDCGSQKQRLLRALAHERQPKGSAGPGANWRHRLRSASTRAAAAAIVLLVIGYGAYTLTMSPAVAWAEVRAQIRQVNTVVFLQRQHTSPTGYWTSSDVSALPVEREYKYLIKTPGMLRMEKWGHVPTSRPADGKSALRYVEIDRRGTDRDVRIQLQPLEKRATRTVARHDPRPVHAPDPSSDPGGLLTQLQQLDEEDLRVLGQAVIDGAKATGFEAPARLVMPYLPDPESTIRVWANQETSLPVRLELRFRHLESYVTVVARQIEWGAPLPDDLFDVPDEPGWTIEEHTTASVVFSKTKLKPGITLHVGPPDGEPIVTEKDIADVSSGWERDEGAYRAVTAKLTSAANARLQAYTRAHVGETLTISFNDEILEEVPIGAAMRNLSLNITQHGMTLEEWEKSYLTFQPE